MAEFDYQNIEAWNTALKLATNVGRLKIGSNLKASADAQQRAYEQAGMACALIAEGSGREGPAQVGMYRDARGALAQCRSWLHILASVTNESDAVFAMELELAEQAARQLSNAIRNAERAPGPGAGPGPARPPLRGGPPPAPRPSSARPGGPR